MQKPLLYLAYTKLGTFILDFEVRLFSFLSKLSLSAPFKPIDNHAVGFSVVYIYSSIDWALFFFGSCYRLLFASSICWSHIFHYKSRIIQWCNAYGHLIVNNKKKIIACCSFCRQCASQLHMQTPMHCLFTNEQMK